jgi:hypothetical protein
LAELLEKISPEKLWKISTKILLTISVLRGVKTVMPLLGKEEGFISPVRGWEKWEEIIDKIQAEGAKRMYSRIKETFNIPVENAVDAFNLVRVVAVLVYGPDWEFEFVEKSPEKVVCRMTRCPWLERYKEFKLDPDVMVCPVGCQAWCEEGLKAVNPKTTFKLVKAMPWGDPYCEEIIEFKEE